MKKISLNLRQKTILSLVLYGVAIAAVGYLSYDDLNLIGRKQEIVELADSLNNVILEMRRYEKNYLLYHHQSDWDENARYTIEATKIVDQITPRIERLQGEPPIRLLRSALMEYQTLMAELPKMDIGSLASGSNHLIGQVRDKGQQLIELTENEAAIERQMIRNILRTLKIQLAFSLTAALMLGALLPMIMFRKIFKPLTLIRQATERIAEGRFEELPVLKTRDEMQGMLEAFNKMVQELESRQEQLIQTQKLTSLGNLTAGVAHQLNNPLNNISTSCQIAVEELEDGEPGIARRMLGNIETETIRARDIVKGLLEFAREQVFSLKKCDVFDLMQRTLPLVSSQVPAGVELSMDIPKGLILEVDSQRIQEVFLNLLTNAVQAIPGGKGRINVRAWAETGTARAFITIEDTGMGIPKEIQTKIFDPFFTTKEVGQGTGLGLSIAYGIVKQHRGGISVESEVGQGTRFTVQLPLFQASAGA